MADYLLTEIPTELWVKAKVKCAQDQITLKEMLMRGIRAYVEPAENQADLPPSLRHQIT